MKKTQNYEIDTESSEGESVSHLLGFLLEKRYSEAERREAEMLPHETCYAISGILISVG